MPAPAAVPAAPKGDHQPAALDTETTRRKIADQAMETLGRSVLAGFADARWMSRDPDLEVLHARDDFQAQVRELFAPPPSASMNQCFAFGQRQRPWSSHQQERAAPANSAVSFDVPITTKPVRQSSL